MWYVHGLGTLDVVWAMNMDSDIGLFSDLPEQLAPAEPSGGQPRLRCAERSQVSWRALSLDDLVPADHRVRLVWCFVEGLDLTALYRRIKAVAGRPGHPPADPRVLMALWLYATVEGIGSARALARLCQAHLAYQWLCGGVSVNHKTLSDFRVGHGAVLQQLLVDGFAALLNAGVADLTRVAQDGVRVRAAAGAASFRRRSTLQACHACRSTGRRRPGWLPPRPAGSARPARSRRARSR